MNRIGFSYDIHKLVDGTGFTLGSIFIPCDKSVVAHSDGDVVLHALTEAIFAALGGDDLGTYFPDTDDSYKGASSLSFLNVAIKMMKNLELRFENINIHILLEKPKLGKYKVQMKEALLRILGLRIDQISIHAGTNEGFGEIGDNRAIKAFVEVLLTDNK